ncbi:hypothetical protein phytr_4660 [Candidatus Phycorickettsia trachydisci]|uniref:Uncharacterized protein n=1 Tax=Candidatus Phycorickettsia trachydisci TaxID=2115978 RepID=A0A2P1P843_9RICK|nr:glycosyltransferase [Candidatus Phycorickettsia trachydisci]AVP87415.1 hypothetical protein phytr_4660 [Candidatus Phycorickettsia trachydisci]
MFYLIFLFSVLSNISLAEPYNNILDVDFFKAITDNDKVATKYLQKNLPDYNLMKSIYETKKPSKMLYSEKPLIPKVMHQIWFGGDIPALYLHYLNECKILHPNWEFKIWNVKDINDLKLEYQGLYDNARSYAGRADIARYEILYRFGGVYRDMDVKCYKPIDDLNHKYDFFVPIEFPTVDWQMVFNNGIIGSKPGHPILKTTLDLIRTEFDKHWKDFDSGDEPIGKLSIMISKSSMLPLKDAFVTHVTLEDKAIAFPPTYFWSLARMKYHTFWSGLKYMIWKDSQDLPSAFHELKPETLMHHNLLKEEILSSTFEYGNGMYDPQVKRFIQNLKGFDAVKFRSFKQLYDDHKPSKIGCNQKGRMPYSVHFVVFDKEELKILEKNLINWKLQNADFEFYIWDKDKIASEFKDLSVSVPNNLQENFRFYLGLRILEKFAGAYADYKAIPHAPIFELNNKHTFYVGLMPFTSKDSKIRFSQKLIGISPNHPILIETLKQIDPKNLSTLEKINEILVDKTYEKAYLYDAVNSRNITLPAVYFEPFAKLENESFSNKLSRFVFRTTKAFSKLTDFVVIE